MVKAALCTRSSPSSPLWVLREMLNSHASAGEPIDLGVTLTVTPPSVDDCSARAPEAFKFGVVPEVVVIHLIAHHCHFAGTTGIRSIIICIMDSIISMRFSII